MINLPWPCIGRRCSLGVCLRLPENTATASRLPWPLTTPHVSRGQQPSEVPSEVPVSQPASAPNLCQKS